MPGPAPGLRCGVCQHHLVAALNHAYDADGGNQSMKRVANMAGLEYQAVRRHFSNRHPGAPPIHGSMQRAVPYAKDEPTGTEGMSALDRLDLLAKQLEREQKRDPRADTARELRQIYAEVGRLSGDSGPRAVTVADVEGLQALVTDLYDSLQPFPDARRAMLGVLERAGLVPAPAPPDKEEPLPS